MYFGCTWNFSRELTSSPVFFGRNLEDVVLESPFALVWHSKCPDDFHWGKAWPVIPYGNIGWLLGYYTGAFKKNAWANSLGEKKVSKNPLRFFLFHYSCFMLSIQLWFCSKFTSVHWENKSFQAPLGAMPLAMNHHKTCATSRAFFLQNNKLISSNSTKGVV